MKVREQYESSRPGVSGTRSRLWAALALAATLVSCIEEPEKCNHSSTQAESAHECSAFWTGCWEKETYAVRCRDGECTCEVDGQTQHEFRLEDACNALENDRRSVFREQCEVDIETTLDPEAVWIETLLKNALLWCALGLVFGGILAFVYFFRRRRRRRR